MKTMTIKNFDKNGNEIFDLSTVEVPEELQERVSRILLHDVQSQENVDDLGGDDLGD